MMCDAVIQESPAGVTILFSEFLRLVRQRKERLHSPVSESDLLMAYVACGGEQDGEGHVERDVLVKLIKQDFELAINIEEMIAQVDEDGSGEIEFGEFCELLAEK
jgi:calmodulin